MFRVLYLLFLSLPATLALECGLDTEYYVVGGNNGLRHRAADRGLSVVLANGDNLPDDDIPTISIEMFFHCDCGASQHFFRSHFGPLLSTHSNAMSIADMDSPDRNIRVYVRAIPYWVNQRRLAEAANKGTIAQPYGHCNIGDICDGNRVINCAMHYMKNDRLLGLQFANCFMHTRAGASDRLTTCFNEVSTKYGSRNISIANIRTCSQAGNELGKELDVSGGQIALNRFDGRGPDRVPSLVVVGDESGVLSRMAENSLTHLLCTEVGLCNGRT